MPKDEPVEVTNTAEYFKKHEKYRKCRRWGHAFEPTHDDYFREHNSGALYQRLRCIRGCGLPAVDTWHPKTMDRIGQRYIDYSAEPDYLARGTHISRLDARLWDRNNRKVRAEPAVNDGTSKKRTG